MALDEDDKKAIGEMLAEALKTNNEARDKELGTLLAKGLGTELGKLGLDKVAARLDKLEKEPPKKTDGDGDGDGKPDPKLEALERQLNEEREARKTAERERQLETMRAKARGALGKHGVKADRVEHALAWLERTGALKLEEDGTFGFVGTDKYEQPALLDIEAGVKAWTSTDDGKVYLPPVQTQGTGDDPPGDPPKTQSGDLDWDALSNEISF